MIFSHLFSSLIKTYWKKFMLSSLAAVLITFLFKIDETQNKYSTPIFSQIFRLHTRVDYVFLIAS